MLQNDLSSDCALQYIATLAIYIYFFHQTGRKTKVYLPYASPMKLQEQLRKLMTIMTIILCSWK